MTLLDLLINRARRIEILQQELHVVIRNLKELEDGLRW